MKANTYMLLVAVSLLAITGISYAEEPTDIERAIDKTAEKLGLAVDRVQPVCEQMVIEYSASYYVAAGYTAVILCLILTAGIVLLVRTRKIKDEEVKEPMTVVTIIVMCIVGCACTAIIGECLFNAQAPTLGVVQTILRNTR